MSETFKKKETWTHFIVEGKDLGRREEFKIKWGNDWESKILEEAGGRFGNQGQKRKDESRPGES